MSLQKTPVCEFGKPAIEFDLEATDGTRWSLASSRGPQGLLVMFICNHCPYVKAIREKLVRDVKALRALGIGSIGIMANDVRTYPEDSLENMRRIAERYQFPFPYVIDESQRVARAYGALCTPDFFGYNARLELQYRGRLDDARADPEAPGSRRELFEAMRQIAATGLGPAEQFPSMGCSIKWRK